MSLFALILAYVFGLLSPLAFLYGPDVVKLASATLAGSAPVPNTVLVLLVLNATVSGLAVLLPAMRSFSTTIKTFLKPSKPASTTFPESSVFRIWPRSASQASLLPVVLELACVLQSRLLKEAATSSPAVLAALAAQDAQDAQEDQPTRVPGAYHDHPALDGKPSLLAIPPLAACGLLLATAFILGSTVSLFLLWALTAWAWAQVHAPLDDASEVTLVNEETECKTSPPSLPAALTSLPASRSVPTLSKAGSRTRLQVGLSRGDDSSKFAIFKRVPSLIDLDVPPSAESSSGLSNNRLDDDPDLTLVGDENTLLSASRSALALPSPQSQTARREVPSPVGVKLYFGSVKALPLAYSRTVSTACVIPGGSKLGLDPLIPSFVPAAKVKPDTAQSTANSTAPLSSAWSRGGCPNAGSKTPSLVNLSRSALALPAPSPRPQNGRPEVPSPVGVGRNFGRAKAVPDPSGGSKSGLDPLVAEFIPTARPSVGTKEKPSAWSRGGCPARITAPPALKASAPVFLPQAGRNEIHAATTRKGGLWAPPESSGIQFRRPPPAFWAPGGRPVPIVAA